MQFLVDLWLPILLAAVLVFVASSIRHMVIPWHRADYGKLPGEAAVLEAMRGKRVPPGAYMFPMPSSMKDMATPAMVDMFFLPWRMCSTMFAAVRRVSMSSILRALNGGRSFPCSRTRST